MLSRRSFVSGVAAGALAVCGCRRKASGFSGFAFVANAEGSAVAAVDLESFAVDRHIRLDANPTQVIANASSGRVYALTPASGCIHEIRTDTLAFSRKVQVAESAVTMRQSSDGQLLFALCREPREVAVVDARSMRVVARTPLPRTPVDMDLSQDGRWVAVSYGPEQAISIFASEDRRAAELLACRGEIGALRFRWDSKCLIAADLSRRMLSLFDVPGRAAMVNLPLAIRPDCLCFNANGGQLFISGEGGDVVAVVYPYYTPEVAETLLAGHSPGAMAASATPAYLFIANRKSGDVTIMDIDTRKVIAITPVGTNPNFIAITPDSNYALVLNETSGDMAVIRTGSIVRLVAERWRSRRGALFMMIPVGSKPVSAAVTPI
jgi:YVTN family beta-propeller protein